MTQKFPKGTLDRLWRDPGHWQGLGRYYCKHDPRVIVPKRIKGFGWTINFANSWAWPTIIIMILSACPLIYLKVYHAPVTAVVVSIALWSIALFLICAVMSSTKRYED